MTAEDCAVEVRFTFPQMRFEKWMEQIGEVLPALVQGPSPAWFPTFGTINDGAKWVEKIGMVTGDKARPVGHIVNGVESLAELSRLVCRLDFATFEKRADMS